MIGSDLMVRQLDALDVRYVALNPGATLRGLHESLLSGGTTHPITCLHEGVAVGLAHGYAKARRAPMAVGLHDTVGVLNGALAVFNAWVDAAPMLVLGGVGPLDTVTRRPWIDWVHTVGDTAGSIREMLVWAETPSSLPAALMALRRAHRRAISSLAGPAYVGLDLPLQELDAALGIEAVGPPMAGWSVAPDAGALTDAVRMLERARRPLLVADRPLSDEAGTVLVRLAEALGAAMAELQGGANVPTGHPLDLTDDLASVLDRSDLLLLVDVRDPALLLRTADGLRRDVAAIEVSASALRAASWMVGASDDGSVLRLVGEPAATLAALLDRVPTGPGPAWATARPDPVVARRTDASALDTAAIAAAAAAVIPRERVVVAHGALEGHARREIGFIRPSQYLGRSGGEGLGYALPASIGAALAWRGSDRIVVGFETDGDTLYLPQALWTAAHEGIPLLAVIENNRTYWHDEIHQRAVAKARGRDPDRSASGVRLDDPAVRLAEMARSFGVEAAGPVTTVGELRAAIARGLEVTARGGPFVIEALTDG